jgi:hypothetical protein
VLCDVSSSSFVISATGDEHFADAVRKKLVPEIAGTPQARASPATDFLV